MPETPHGFKNLYAILGVPEDASFELISASYKAMVKAFHPDVFKGDRDFAESRLKEINDAFSVLRDTQKREAYDFELRVSRSQQPPPKATNEQSFDVQWRRACDFFPELASLHNQLTKISPELGDVFRAIVTEMRAFSEAEEIKKNLIEEFAKRKFGSNDLLQRVGLKALELGHREFALKINQACNLIGEDNGERILNRLSEEHPSEAIKILRECGLDVFTPEKVARIKPGLYKANNRIAFRVLPDLSITVFEEDGVHLLAYKRFSDVDKMLRHYNLQWGSIES